MIAGALLVGAGGGLLLGLALLRWLLRPRRRRVSELLIEAYLRRIEIDQAETENLATRVSPVAARVEASERRDQVFLEALVKIVDLEVDLASRGVSERISPY